MTASATAILGYAGWMLLLLVLVVVMRTVISQRTEKQVNEFSPGGEDVPGFGHRVTRAHLNCVENIGPFIAIIVAAYLSDQLAVTDQLAMWVLYARIAQSVVHLISTALPMVMIRGTLLLVQIALQGWMIFQLAF
ncbi:MAG: MAPEG family protein [Pseudomonadota bacterium]|nr:MAPEG family protein [Pseudomonadota bacterium]